MESSSLSIQPARGSFLLFDSAAPTPGHAVRMSCINHLFGTYASNTALLPPEEDFFLFKKKYLETFRKPTKFQPDEIPEAGHLI